MNRTLTSLLLLLFSANICFANNWESLIKTCAQTSDTSARINCYEDLGQRALNNSNDPVESTNAEIPTSEQIVIEPSQTSPAEEKIQNLPDTIGGGDFSKGIQKPQTFYRGHVTSCKRAHDRKWFYIFENKQVWKQVDKRVRHHKKNCGFDVSITEDGFGYVMRIDGKNNKIRVKRQR